jgi:signal transduction histidine kinase
MSAGYSSGWCAESFGLPLTATEVACRARGDANCTFVMAPPHRLQAHVERFLAGRSAEERRQAVADIPALFERKDAEERLRDSLAQAREAGEAKGRFLANMSHEIRTPLTGILGMALLLRDLDLPPPQRGYVETIERSGQALLGVLNDVLDAAKIDAGMMTVALSPCDVRAVLGDVETMVSAKVAEKGLEFRRLVAPEVPPHVESDPGRLRQVLLNLVANAVKFTAQGHVEVRIHWDAPGTLTVEVEDTGIGIDPSHLPRVFEDFTQADTSASRRYGGTGLGLGLSRRFVHLLGGEISARSARGAGSTFSFRVPAPACASPTPPAATPVRRPRPGSRILLIDDDPVARHVVEKLLERLDLHVETAVDGLAGFEAWAARAPDLVLMDCHMPVLDGFEATRRIRARERGSARTPILAMTAGVMQEDSERCRAAGMDDFVGKPVDPERLTDALARWLPVTP